MTRRSRRAWVLGLIVGLASGIAQAHDAWPRPTSFTPGIGELVRVDLELDDGAGNREILGRPASPPLRRFVAVAPEGRPEGLEVPLLGVPGQRPAGLWRPDISGSWVLVYENDPREHTLDAATFRRYLEEEGLEHVPTIPELSAAAEGSTRELWSRHAKALVLVGDGGTPTDRVLGLDLEITLVHAAAGTVAFEVLRAGKPVANALVDLYPGTAGPSTHARSTPQGRVSFPCPTGPAAATTTTLERWDRDGITWRGYFAALALDVAGACSAPRGAP